MRLILSLSVLIALMAPVIVWAQTQIESELPHSDPLSHATIEDGPSCFKDAVLEAGDTAPYADRVVDAAYLTADAEDKFGNGFWHVEDHSLPIVTIAARFWSGAVLDPESRQGLSIFLTSLFDEGAGELTAQQFQQQLADENISMSFFSTRDTIELRFKTLTSHKDKAVEMLKSALTEPRFDEDAIERMRAQHLSRLKNAQKSPDWRADRLMLSYMYPDHPYALNSGGTLSSLAAITKLDIEGAWQAKIDRNNVEVVIVGDISADEARGLYNEVFVEALPDYASSQELPLAPYPLDTEVSERTYIHPYDSPQSHIRVVWDGVDFYNQAYPAALVFNHIFGGGGFSSRLMEEIREKRGLTYGVSTYLDEKSLGDRFILSLSTDNKNVKEVLELIRFELEKLAQELVSEDELNDAVNYLTGSLPISMSSTDRTASKLLSVMGTCDGVYYYDALVEALKSVTAEDVRDIARIFLQMGEPQTFIVGQPEGEFPEAVTVDVLENIE